jgi:hypothetical protein
MPTLELERDEIVTQIDEIARRHGYNSASDLIHRWNAGTLRDTGAVASALILADLLDPADPLLLAP